MDIVGHSVQGSLTVLIPSLLWKTRRRNLVAVVAIAFAVLGAAPDLIGFFGNVVLADNWGLYNSAHSGEIYSILAFAPPYWLHCWIDSFTHGAGSRWWIVDEGLWIEVLLWNVNLALVLLYIYKMEWRQTE